MKTIKVILDRIRSDQAILITADKKEICLPVSELPSMKKGDQFSIEIKTEKEAKISQTKLARKILNEILKNE